MCQFCYCVKVIFFSIKLYFCKTIRSFVMENFENYNQEQKIVDIVWANIFGLLILIPIIIFYGIPYFLIWGYNYERPENFNSFFLLFILCFLVGVVIHELIHGITFAAFAKSGFKSIRFGVMWKMITPYCNCKESLKIKHYIIGALMPGIVLGLIPAILAVVFGSYFLLLVGVVFTIAASGDVLIVWSLRKENKNDYVLDHPSEAGCIVYRKKTEE